VKALFLDLFGASGGVGRCSREIFQQLERDGISAVLCGQSHVVDSFRDRLPAMSHLQMINLERPKISLKSLKIKFASRHAGQSPRLANTLLSESIKAAQNGRPLSTALVTFPQMIAPPDINAKYCVFIHDLNWRLYPGNFSDPGLIDHNCRGWVDRATKVIANSRCTRDEVIAQYGCAPEKVIAAPLAPFHETASVEFDSTGYLTGLGLKSGQYYLFPGVWGLHKGHETLTEAIEKSAGTSPVVVTCGMPLAGIQTTGESLAEFRRSLAARWDKLIAERRLVVLHNLPEAEMQALRINCRAYVIPARYEGFGFPMAEAVYHHRPAIVSDIPAHREILQRYPQYQLATVVPAGSSSTLAVELDRPFREPPPTPVNWHQDIDNTWSWKQTTQKLLSAMGVETVTAP